MFVKGISHWQESLLIWNHNYTNMTRFVRLLHLFILLLTCYYAGGQQAAAVDSLKAAVNEAKTDEEKVFWLDNLSRTLMNVNLKEADKYGQQLITFAEETRDRKLMVTAYISNGLRCSYFASQKEYIYRSIEFYNKALAIARQNKMEPEIGGIQLRLASIHLAIPDKDKALSFVSQAFSLISSLSNDSLLAEAHNTYGTVYLTRNDKTLALRHYLTALRITEETKQKFSKAEVLRNCYLYLSNFYSGIEDYDKAIDYYALATKKLDDIKQRNAPYQRAMDINAMGNLFAQKKNYDIAISYFERSIALADSLKFSTLKIPGYVSLLNQYLRMDEPQKALDYLASSPGQTLQTYLRDFGMPAMIDQAYAVVFTQLNQFDSARKYFTRATPYFEQSSNEGSKLSYYRQLAGFYKKTGETKQAIAHFLKVKEIGEKTGVLEYAENAAKQLDTLYAKSGDYKLSSQYSGVYYMYKDSIEKLNKEKDLAQVEAADEQHRLERLAMETEEAKRRRNNIQYLAITIGIALFFIALVVLGMFKVSATTIKMIGFFAFIMFFEFIFLIFKKNIYSLTQGEPWKDLLFMIGLAAVLLPLHHWLEHKVIKYLTSHNRLTTAGEHLKRKLFRRADEG